jgi:hypothetical protein
MRSMRSSGGREAGMVLTEFFWALDMAISRTKNHGAKAGHRGARGRRTYIGKTAGCQ